MPGLSEWARVRDYRVFQLQQMPNVEIYLESGLNAEQVREFGFDRVAIATGAHWRRDGVGRHHSAPIEGSGRDTVFAPDDVMRGARLTGPVLVYDSESAYLGSLMVERLCEEGHEVTLVSPTAQIAGWTQLTMEQPRITARIIGAVVLVTSRLPNDNLYHDLVSDSDALVDAGIKSVDRIGDCLAPHLIAAAVYSGHRYAQEMDEDVPETPFSRKDTVWSSFAVGG